MRSQTLARCARAEGGIGGDRGFQPVARGEVMLFIARCIEQVAAAQVVKVGHGAGCRRTGVCRCTTREPDAQAVRNLVRNIRLHGECIIELAIVGVGPQVVARTGINQLHLDTDGIACAANAAIEDGIDAECASQGLKVVAPVAQLERR